MERLILVVGVRFARRGTFYGDIVSVVTLLDCQSRVRGSIPRITAIFSRGGSLAAKASACHALDRGFESPSSRHFKRGRPYGTESSPRLPRHAVEAQLEEQVLAEHKVDGFESLLSRQFRKIRIFYQFRSTA